MPPTSSVSDPVALINGNNSLTIADLLEKSKKLALGLKIKGFQENDIVLITLPPSEEFLIIIYAVAMLHGTVAIIDPEMGRKHFTAKLKQLTPKWAFVDSRLLFVREHRLIGFVLYKMGKIVPEIGDVQDCLIISTGPWVPTVRKYLRLKKMLREGEEVQFIHDNCDHEFLIIYTSGTIQEPKGVVHTFSSLTKSIRNLIKLIDKKPGDILGTELPHYMLLGIAADIPVNIFSSGLSASAKIREIEQKKITLLFGAPSEYLPLIQHCENAKRKLPSSLRKVFFGSAPVHATFLKRFFLVAPIHIETMCLYGMTELLLCASIGGKDKLAMNRRHGDVLGKLLDDVACKIGEDGEILLSSPQLFSRYFHEKGRDEFHASGDSGLLDERNNLILTGRKKDMIIRKNFNIYPVIYETIIRNIEGVDDCAIVGIWSDQKEDEEVCLVLEGRHLIPERIRAHLSYGPNAIPKEVWPDVIVCMHIPRHGKHEKIDKKKLRVLLKKPQAFYEKRA
ncbi:MAG: acyl--CoA ligase [Cyclobacteriaceae bacterium]|nr:acyl--CoA ligase [Cyclobacteriaceae bacterium]MDH5249585.1 acyl--CoA ligase [Cyclobacteriaceae bacterium]